EQRGFPRPHFAGQPPIVFEGFTTLNTDASRPGIGNDQMFWCDGWMPLGKNNLRTLPGVGTILFTSAAPSVICFYFANIGATPWMIVFLSDGSVDAVNTDSGAETQIMPPGTIQSPSIGNVGVSQWAATYVIIVSKQPNGYWLWDGALVYGAGTIGPVVTITDGGGGYVQNSTTVTVTGGSGSGATFTPVVTDGVLVAIDVTNPGSGYLASDFDVYVPGTTDILTVSIVGVGTSAAAQVGIVLPSPGLMPFGVSGTTVETYTSHVWVGNVGTVTFSAPDDPTDFATSDGGGSFKLNDSFTRVGVLRLVENNGFLWIVCDSSISYISNVNTAGTPPTTTFTKQNANPEVGTPWPAGVQTFGQYLVFGTTFGVHYQSGGQVDKISEFLDGVYNTVPNFGGLSPSSAKATIFGKKVWMILLQVVDQITGQTINKLFMWAGKGWWSSQQDMDLIYIAGQEINSVQTAYGTDGTSIFPLFQTPSTGFTKRVQSKLFSEPGGYMNVKTATRLWGLIQYYSDLAREITVAIDNETGSTGGNSEVVIDSVGQLVVTWHTAAGLVMNWTTAAGAPMVWSISGVGIAVFPPTAVGQQGVLTGLTVTTNAADAALISLMIGDVIQSYRG
ncbi:MAG: hypothetical protein P4L86_30985, partial [Mycobacterium sp.]|nr:hypothetical protein [Mycobacterium sp.]